MYGIRRMAKATAMMTIGAGLFPRMLMKWSGLPSPKGHLSVIATYPNATTTPGTASGNMHIASSMCRPRILVRTITYAASRAKTLAIATAATESFSEFTMDAKASGCPRACWKLCSVMLCGRTL